MIDKNVKEPFKSPYDILCLETWSKYVLDETYVDSPSRVKVRPSM